jgi:hypothetical protein
MTNKHYDIHAIVVDGEIGMLEGVESYIKDGKPISLPFMSVFRFRDGKVCSWRDYFDMTTLLKQLQAYASDERCASSGVVQRNHSCTRGLCPQIYARQPGRPLPGAPIRALRGRYAMDLCLVSR